MLPSRFNFNKVRKNSGDWKTGRIRTLLRRRPWAPFFWKHHVAGYKWVSLASSVIAPTGNHIEPVAACRCIGTIAQRIVRAHRAPRQRIGRDAHKLGSCSGRLRAADDFRCFAKRPANGWMAGEGNTVCLEPASRRSTFAGSPLRPRAQPGTAFAGVPTSRTHGGLPVIDGSVGYLECEPAGKIESGDHFVFLARVSQAI